MHAGPRDGGVRRACERRVSGGGYGGGYGGSGGGGGG